MSYSEPLGSGPGSGPRTGPDRTHPVQALGELRATSQFCGESVNQVVTWGLQEGGGDSTAVQDQLHHVEKIQALQLPVVSGLRSPSQRTISKKPKLTTEALQILRMGLCWGESWKLAFEHCLWCFVFHSI